MSVEDKVIRFLEGVVVPSEAHVVVGCSGGIDSICLLHALVQSGRFAQISACYVHHGLHEQSDEHAGFVARQAERLGVLCSTEFVDRQLLQTGKGIEDGARRARYACLEHARIKHCADYIAVGHHRLDQLETFMIRLSQGSGIRGLSGMEAVRERVIRPLLDVTKDELKSYASHHQLEWVQDPTNRDPRFLRNSIRQTVVPAMDDALGPQWREHLSRLMDELGQRHLDDERRAVEQADVFVTPREKGVTMPRACLSQFSKLDALLLIRRILETMVPSGTARRVQVETVYQLSLGAQTTTRQNLGDDIWCVVEYEAVFLGRLHTEHNEYCKITRPGVYQWRDWCVGVGQPLAGGFEVELPAPLPSVPLILRSPQSGDLFSGRSGRRKLSRLLIDRKVPRRLRKEVLMIEFRGALVWGAGFGRSTVSALQNEDFAPLWIKPSRDFTPGY